MSHKKPIPMREIIDAAGGAIALGRALNISRSAVYRWKKVPSDRLQAVARVTGIEPEKLRPDIFHELPVARPNSKPQKRRRGKAAA